MKRCPACKRVENDDTLVFCRADGTPLVSNAESAGVDLGTINLSSSTRGNEIETSILPHTTDSTMNCATAPTTVLPVQQTGRTNPLAKPKRRRTAIAIAVILTAVVAATSAIVVDSYLSKKTSAAIHSVAVLPFTNQSGNADVEYLSDGITESLINSLSQLPNLSVKARSTVFHYKGKDVTPQQVGLELSVQAVLNGRVMQRGDQLTLNLELVDARTGDQIWGEQYNRRTADLVSLQSEIARDVSNKLRVKLSGADEQKLAKNYTANPEAYQLYLKGRFYWNKRAGEALKKSIEYFNQAIEKDPNYAQAYAGLADAYALMPVYSAGSPQEFLPKAKAAAMKALEIDDTLAEAHASLSLTRWSYDRNFAESCKELQRAIELSPNYATAHHWYGENLGDLGRFDEGLAELKRALDLDPLSLIINADLGEVYTFARQYDKAIEQLRKTIEMDQSFYYAHWRLGVVYELKGFHQEAIAEYQKARALDSDPWVLALIGHADATSGKRDEALKIVDQLREISKQRYVSAYGFAIIYAQLGEKDEAFRWLEKSNQDRGNDLGRIKVDPLVDSLRSDPRFADLMRRVGLPQ
jgi:TolB-like protein/Tfp pilus assembly protein PilF